ncbi:hypothetical protein ACP70R_049665 [Stipagrostis hirtigluma subsp. patula]
MDPHVDSLHSSLLSIGKEPDYHEDIDNFRMKLAVQLVDSPHNRIGGGPKSNLDDDNGKIYDDTTDDE